MTDRKRSPLPKGYQFGDAGGPYRGPVLRQLTTGGSRGPMDGFRLGVDVCTTCGTSGKYDCPDCGCWNVIEGEHG